jgi:FKBP-type peptidyl-prolyl cis-trans isomerase
MKHSALLSGAALFLLLASGCNEASTGHGSSSSSSVSAGASASEPAADKPAGEASTAPAGPEVELAGGLRYTDLKVGDGDIAETGLNATVHYTGWLTDGTKFDSSLDSGQPYRFRIGQGVIAGWSEGVKGMRVGGKRHLTIPPDLGYGANGYPPVIPPNATLVFDIELLGLSH